MQRASLPPPCRQDTDQQPPRLSLGLPQRAAPRRRTRLPWPARALPPGQPATHRGCHAAGPLVIVLRRPGPARHRLACWRRRPASSPDRPSFASSGGRRQLPPPVLLLHRPAVRPHLPRSCSRSQASRRAPKRSSVRVSDGRSDKGSTGVRARGSNSSGMATCTRPKGSLLGTASGEMPKRVAASAYVGQVGMGVQTGVGRASRDGTDGLHDAIEPGEAGKRALDGSIDGVC